MKTNPFALFLILTSSFLQAQFTGVDWVKVNTTISWLNSYNEPGQLTLSLNGFRALKNVRPGGYFAPTKVPLGTYQAEISDSRKTSPLDQFSLVISNNILVVTKGNDSKGFKSLVIEEQGKSSDQVDASEISSGTKKSNQVIFVNGIADAKLTVVLPGDPPRSIEVSDMTSVQLSPEILNSEITANLVSKNGGSRSEKVKLADYTQNGAVVVYHCDEVDQQIVRFSVFDGSSFRMLSVDSL